MKVDPDIAALIRWRDSMALDWYGYDLVAHVSVRLAQMDTDKVPKQYKTAHTKFKSLSEEDQFQAVGDVLGWS